MGLLSLDRAYAMIARLPPEERARSTRALAGAVTCELNEGAGWSALDPLECTPQRASHCLSAGGVVAVGSQVCLSVLDQDLACPYGARGR